MLRRQYRNWTKGFCTDVLTLEFKPGRMMPMAVPVQN